MVDSCPTRTGYGGRDCAAVEYSEAVLVTEEDVAVFDAACGGYKFPVGTSVTAAKRSYDGTEDYCFDVKSQMPDGRESL